MRQVLRFESNQPQTIALEFPEGVSVPGQYGPQVRFSLTENRLMYLDLDVAQAIKTLGVEPGQPFTICKRWEKGRKVWWEVEKAKSASGASEAIRAAGLPPTPSPAPKLEPTSSETANRLVSHAEPVRIPPKPAPTPIADSTPRTSGMQLTRTPPVKPSYEEAFRECLRIVTAGLAQTGEQWSDGAKQAMVSTLMIQLGRENRLGEFRPQIGKVA